ncbi:MAG: hypothetical protein RLY58_2187 [Pseudomonadota bacterium]|jgi:type IV pilus assembly protein PilN
MAKINLLPWREELREQRKKEFLVIMAAAFMLALVIAGLTWAFFNNRLSDQEQANQQVVAANSQLDSKLKSLDGLQDRRDAIVARMKVIQDLQGKRPVVVRLFDELTRMMPVNMYLTRFKRDGDKFTIEGKAESPNTVSELLRSLEASPWFRNAFMNAFQGVVIDPKQEAQSTGGVLPRPEDSYGSFVVSVDLEEPEPVGTEATAGQPPASTTGSTP